MLRKIRRGEKGFSLIELMIVIAIIGILAAIAIPQFAAYRQRGFNADAQSHVRNLCTSLEAYFADNQSYAGATTNLLTNYGYVVVGGVTPGLTAAANAYSISASHT